ncbi:hypothetical protein R2325_14120 [Mycobacteroides chelonae]|nr:hypothetical protein [Mycobacteroides chelonae]MEC4873163.1 hypothetical protein [Mycobacteroides chelonae]
MPYSPASWGYTDAEWDRLLDATEDSLQERISTSSAGLPRYSQVNEDIAQRTGLPSFDLSETHGRNGIGWLLGALNDRLWDEAGCLVSSVVVHKDDASIGNAFFTYARGRGLNPGTTSSERTNFLIDQQIQATEFWHTRQAD